MKDANSPGTDCLSCKKDHYGKNCSIYCLSDKKVHCDAYGKSSKSLKSSIFLQQ